MTRARLGIVVTHPIQYQVPLFRHLASHSTVEPIVFFLSNHGLTESFDAEFGRAIKYDVPLLGGYEHKFALNCSPKPAVNKLWGVINPSLPALIRRSRIDALLVHGYSNISHWLAYATAAALRVPYLLRSDSQSDNRNAPRAKIMTKQALIGPLVRNAAACLAIGKCNREFYESYGAADGQIFFAPYSVDTDRFSTTGAIGRARRAKMLESFGLNPEVPLVLFAAKLQPWKRPLDVVMAIDQLEHPTNLIVIGDGPLKPYIDKLASERPWMRTLGFVNQTKIAEWYGAADIFTLPSSRERWGLAVNEAMAAGAVPIVSDAVGCAPDLVTSDVGWVHEVGDIAALRRSIAEGCQTGALSERRAAAQRRSTEYGIAATSYGIETAVTAALSRDARLGPSLRGNHPRLNRAGPLS